MDIRQLQYVLVLERCRNFTKAASELFITQPSLSNSISLVEEELGVTLFTRTTRSVILTEAGAVFVEKAKRIKSDWDDLFLSLEPYRSHNVVPLKIGMEFVAHCSPILFANTDFFVQHTDYDVSYLTNSEDILLSRLHAGRLDVVFSRLPIDGNNAPFKDDFHAVPLIREERCVIMSESHELAHCDRLDISDLRDYTLIVGLKGSSVDTRLKRVEAQLNLEPFNVIRTDSTSVMVRLLKEGKGVLMGPKFIASRFGLVAIPTRTPAYSTIGLIYSAKNPKPILLELEAYMRENVSNLE